MASRLSYAPRLRLIGRPQVILCAYWLITAAFLWLAIGSGYWAFTDRPAGAPSTPTLLNSNAGPTNSQCCLAGAAVFGAIALAFALLAVRRSIAITEYHRQTLPRRVLSAADRPELPTFLKHSSEARSSSPE